MWINHEEVGNTSYMGVDITGSSFGSLFGPLIFFNPFAPGDFAEKRVLKLVEWFSGHCRAIKS